MARGGHSPTPAPLPKVSFVRIRDELATQPAGVHDNQAKAFGYNDGSDFQRADRYIRYIEPLDSDLDKQVEYDMDEQDQEWLDAINVDRKKEQLDRVSYEAFEVIMDRLEKEWFGLTKNIPQPDMALPSEDSTCAICDDSEGENMNAIVFCDGCNLAVHQDCYGVPYIPEGQWLCRKCTVSPESAVSCILCPNEGGAFKQTVNGEWVHLLCAIWVPETRVANEVFMEPVTGVDKVPKQRWKLKCSICDIREGACIQCTKSSCFSAFHPTCARKEKFLMPMKSVGGAEAMLACYCEKHLPEEQQKARAISLANRDSGSDDEGGGGALSGARASKSARAYAKTYKTGPPLVPALIVDRIMQYIGRIAIRKKTEFVLLVCKYWSLKREVRRGAPLLKRLHLEPWTATAGSKQQSDEDKVMKLKHMKHLRQDLENVRALADLCRQREAYKLKQSETVQNMLSHALFPHEMILRMTFEKISGSDRNDYFKDPVSRTEVPDYFDVIERPMCWGWINGKLERHEYWDVETFREDILLVLNNAMKYNKSESPFYKTAQRIRTASKAILSELDKLARPHPASSENGAHTPATQAGDLEPPLGILTLLLHTDAIQADIDLILRAEPIASLFAYEHPVPKPPPPPPTPPPPKRKRDFKAEKEERERKRLAKEERRMSMLDEAPGFRAPRTRRAAAAAAAFEAEAEGGGAGPSAGPSSAGPSAEPGSGMVPEAGEDAEAPAQSVSARKISVKRAQARVPGQALIPPVVNEVDNRQSFKMFDAGWILPPGQRRGGRAPVEKQPLPPPKKRVKENRDREKSALSTGTPASENQTLEIDPPPGSERSSSLLSSANSGDAQGDAMDVDTSSSAIKDENGGDKGRSPSIEGTAPSSAKNTTRAPKRVVIDVIETPATRREERLRLKAEREANAARAAEQSIPISVPDGRRSGRKGKSRAKARGQGEGSEFSDLSDLESGAAGETEESAPEQGEEKALEDSSEAPVEEELEKSGPAETPVGSKSAEVDPDKLLESGTLVWAKADKYPWWPAVTFDEDHEEVPQNVLRLKDDARKAQKGPLHLVRFYDSRSSWQWVNAERLKLLGEDKAYDDSLLKGTLKGQNFKAGKQRTNCQADYKRAIAEMETEADARVAAQAQEQDAEEDAGSADDSSTKGGEEAQSEEAASEEAESQES